MDYNWSIKIHKKVRPIVQITKSIPRDSIRYEGTVSISTHLAT
jgi:hypothetical protein